MSDSDPRPPSHHLKTFNCSHGVTPVGPSFQSQVALIHLYCEALADLLGSNYHSETINYKVILSSNLETLPGKLYDSKMLQIMFALDLLLTMLGLKYSIVLNYPALR